MKRLLLKHIILQLFVLTVATDFYNNFSLLSSSFIVIALIASIIIYYYAKNKFKNLHKIKYKGALYVHIIIISFLITLIKDFVPINYTNPTYNLITDFKVIGLSDGEMIEDGLTNDDGELVSYWSEKLRFYVNADDFKESSYLTDSSGEFKVLKSKNNKGEVEFSYQYFGDDFDFENGVEFVLNARFFENKQIAFIKGYKNLYNRKVDVNQLRLPLDYLKHFIVFNIEKILILFMFFYFSGFTNTKRDVD